jgi:hypothetical protein
MGDLVDRASEGGFVGLRRLLGAAHLAHVLERSSAHLVLGRGRLEVVECLDVSTHAGSLASRPSLGHMLLDGIGHQGRIRGVRSGFGERHQLRLQFFDLVARLACSSDAEHFGVRYISAST